MKKQRATRRFDATQLMVLKNSGAPEFSSFARLEDYLHPKDLLVVNLSGTIPGSLWVRQVHRIRRIGREAPFEIRLAAYAGNSLTDLRDWWAVSFGSGNWSIPTEERGSPPVLKVDDILNVTPTLSLEVCSVDPQNGRLLKLSFLGKHFLSELYLMGHPIQYSYQENALELWHVQTPLAQLPLSVEAPSALFPFSWSRFLAMKTKFPIAYLYHGAGISSTGEASLDERLPLPEFYSIPKETVRAWQETRLVGGRVIAVGTTVTRALESAKSMGEGEPRLLEGMTNLRVRQGSMMEHVDGMLTGYHDPLTSHFDLEAAFVGAAVLEKAFEKAKERDFQKHEFGDTTLLLSK